MGPRWIAIVAALLAGASQAEPVDPLGSDACKQALATLQAQDDAAAAAADPRAGLAQLTVLRHDAAHACLGTAADLPSAAQRLAQPPVAVAPVSSLTIAPHVVAPAIPSAPLSRPAGLPRVITGCDVSGCWASDGSRLNRAGPNLIGPGGLCRVQGTQLLCP